MSPPAPPVRRSHRHERGAITWITALLIVAVIGGAYLAWVWVPIWVVHYEVKQVVRDYMNRAIKDRSDESLKQMMTDKLRTLDTVDTVNEQGTPEKAPAIEVNPEDVTWDRITDTTPPTLHVSFTYTRPVDYPLLDRRVNADFSIDLTNDLTIPNWGPSR